MGLHCVVGVVVGLHPVLGCIQPSTPRSFFRQPAARVTVEHSAPAVPAAAGSNYRLHAGLSIAAAAAGEVRI